MQNHETIEVERLTWKRTYGSVSALAESDTLSRQNALKKLSEFNVAALSCRVIMEAAQCSSPLNEGLDIDALDLGELIAIASTMIQLGGDSEAIRYGATKAEVVVSQFGDILMNRDFKEQVVDPLGTNVMGSILKHSADTYGELYQDGEASSSTSVVPMEVGSLKDEVQRFGLM